MDGPRTGFVTQIGMEYEEALRVAGTLGFDHVELMMDGATERRQLADDLDALRSLLDEHDLDLLVHLPFKLDVGSPFEHVREGAVRELKAAIETAADAGAEKGVVHASSNAWGPAWDDGEIASRVLDSIAELVAFGEARGVEVCAENVPRGFVTVHDFDLLFEETDVSMTLDTGHARIDGLDSGGMASFVADHGDRISHVHLNDTRQARDEHLPFGSGTIDFAAVLGALPDDWSGTLSLEVFTLDYGYVETSKERLDDLVS